MRGVIRKALKIDGWIWIIFLSLLLLTVYFSFSDAAAITRAELNELKESEENLQEDLTQYDDKIQDKYDEIDSQEIEIDEIESDIKSLETGVDWDSIKEKLDREDDLFEAIKILNELKLDLNDLLDEKNDLFLSLRVLGDKILNSEIDKPPSLSHLTTKIGVSLSKSCEIMIKNNFTSNCPTYKHLVQLDSSDTDISGKFTTSNDGFFHRGDEIVDNSYRYYWNDEQIRIFVDPPSTMIDRIKMIYIQPNFDTYTISGDMTEHDEFEIIMVNRTETLNNQTRVVTFENRTQTESFGTVLFHDRYIKNCNEATINANNWKFLIGDTIHLMRNDCDRTVTQFEEREIIFPEYSVIDITTSPNWIYQQWLKHTEEFCIFKYKQC